MHLRGRVPCPLNSSRAWNTCPVLAAALRTLRCIRGTVEIPETPSHAICLQTSLMKSPGDGKQDCPYLQGLLGPGSSLEARAVFPRQSLCVFLRWVGGQSYCCRQLCLSPPGLHHLLSRERLACRHVEFCPFLEHDGVSLKLQHSQDQSPKCACGFS